MSTNEIVIAVLQDEDIPRRLTVPQSPNQRTATQAVSSVARFETSSLPVRAARSSEVAEKRAKYSGPIPHVNPT
jgi:hypothetical protein